MQEERVKRVGGAKDQDDSWYHRGEAERIKSDERLRYERAKFDSHQLHASITAAHDRSPYSSIVVIRAEFINGVGGLPSPEETWLTPLKTKNQLGGSHVKPTQGHITANGQYLFMFHFFLHHSVCSEVCIEL